MALAIHVIPVIALHLPFALGDHHAAETVAGAGIATDEAMAVAIHATALVAAQAGAIGIADTRVGVEGRRLAEQRALDCLLRGDIPGVIEVQLRQVARHQRGIGQAGALVLGGMLGNGQGGGHGFANGRLAGGRSTGRALALADVEGDAETLITIEFDGFHLALTHRGGQPLLHRHGDLAGRSALLPGLGENLFDLRLQTWQCGGSDYFHFTHNDS